MRSTLRYGDCAVDVGAHKGGYLYWMRRAVGPTGRVFAFEPQQDLAQYLKERVAEFAFDNVIVEGSALSDVAGHAILDVPGEGPACGATLEPGLPGSKISVAVEVRTLDEYFGARPGLRVALIKCDAEGHELRIFRGAETILSEQRPILLFECEARHNRRQSIGDVFDLLGGLGYRGFFFREGALLPLSQFVPAMQSRPKARSYVNNFVFQPSSTRPT